MSVTANTTTTQNRFLSFSLGKEEYAIPIEVVREVIAVPSQFTPVPYAPPYYLGLMNLRGQVLSAIDLRKKLALTPNKTGEEAIVIVDFGEASIGLMVDSVNSVIQPEPGEVTERPSLESNRSTEYLTGVYRVDSRLVLLIDPLRIIDGADREIAKRQAA